MMFVYAESLTRCTFCRLVAAAYGAACFQHDGTTFFHGSDERSDCVIPIQLPWRLPIWATHHQTA